MAKIISLKIFINPNNIDSNEFYLINDFSILNKVIKVLMTKKLASWLKNIASCL